MQCGNCLQYFEVELREQRLMLQLYCIEYLNFVKKKRTAGNFYLIDCLVTMVPRVLHSHVPNPLRHTDYV